MSAPPIICAWDGEVFRPLPRFARLADRHYVVGETYPIVVHEDRSEASHRQYFAAIREAWQNLPEPYASMLPTAEHLRKYALCKTGYANQMQIACASKAEAIRAVTTVRALDSFAVVDARDAVVTVWTAASQSHRAMGKKDFQASKTAVLDFVAGLIGTTRSDLGRNAGRAA